MATENPFHKTARYAVVICSVTLMTLILGVLWLSDVRVRHLNFQTEKNLPANPVKEVLWKAPDLKDVPRSQEGDDIRYGKELIEHTALHLGPNGKVAQITNGMNCQNCHLRGGTKPFGNNYAFVASTYPKFRARSGTIESVEKRINDCIERSLNGSRLDENSREIKAMKAYILWVGKETSKDGHSVGMGLGELPLLNRPADPAKGMEVYKMYCERCHNENGRGRRLAGKEEWLYPPLSGDSSYNIGAGLFRLSRFAAYVKLNMPDGTTFDKPVLTDEQAWDVAAYINSLPRPAKDISRDWPDISTKPFDHPFGPYADSFSEQQHKYGPFAVIRKSKSPNGNSK